MLYVIIVQVGVEVPEFLGKGGAGEDAGPGEMRTGGLSNLYQDCDHFLSVTCADV